MTIGANPCYPDAAPAVMAVSYAWSALLDCHSQVHLLVSAGGASGDELVAVTISRLADDRVDR